ncbi:MAG: sigma-54-dependent Fis family transcriptional regulator [Desulfobacterales bacterium]|nr:sigma-54-dependent Fis family transcriptional regulator [Desulfobacterales bacterium]
MDTDPFFSWGIIGRARAMTAVFDLVRKVSVSDATVILTGETGTGKGIIAKAIHDLSGRSDKPFVTINCGAIPEHLLESELFGHVRGAFTGATVNKDGKFEMANGGTVFLDEIGDMSPDLQVKILRVLEEREFEPVGGTRTVRADVRIIAATHRDLEDSVQKGRFRQDLYYRLFVIPILLPSLKDRPSDIPLLIAHFLGLFGRRNHTRPPVVSESTMTLLKDYAWPGNVRELKNLMERWVVLHGDGTVTPADLPPSMHGSSHNPAMPNVLMGKDGICLNTAVSAFEKALIMESLRKTNGIKNQAAKLLHLNRTTLVEKIKRHQLRD